MSLRDDGRRESPSSRYLVWKPVRPAPANNGTLTAHRRPRHMTCDAVSHESLKSIPEKRTRLSRRQFPRATAVITVQDRRRLGNLIADDDAPLAARKLEEKLEEAAYVEQNEPLIVAMHDTVELADVSTGESRVATLVYLDEAEIIDGSVSVVKPLGLELLGSAIGSVIQCGEGHDATQMEILRIVD